jgi:hypothetical protein
MIQFLPMLALFGGVALFFVFQGLLRRRIEWDNGKTMGREPGFVVSRARVVCGLLVAAALLMFGFRSLT